MAWGRPKFDLHTVWRSWPLASRTVTYNSSGSSRWIFTTVAIVSTPFLVTKTCVGPRCLLSIASTASRRRRATLEPFFNVSANAACFLIFWRLAFAALAWDLESGGAGAGAGAAAFFRAARSARSCSSVSSSPGGPESSESSES